MTIFLNSKVAFINLFSRNFGKESDKQVGVIADAVNTLNKINEDISVSLVKDKDRIAKIEESMYSKRGIRVDNDALANALYNILDF